MRKRIILSLISIFAFVFFSCSGLLNDIDEDSSSNKAYVQIGNTSSRTVLPEALNTDAMIDIKLIGVKDEVGTERELLSAETFSELSGKTAEIEPGTWSFELQAKIGEEEFCDTKSYEQPVEVSAGDTLRLVFSAMEAGENGDFSVKVNYTGEEPGSVDVSLDDENLSGYMVSRAERYVYVSGSASSGDHKLKIEFYDGDSLLNTFREIIRVKGGLSSEEEYTITLNTSPAKQSEKIKEVLSRLNKTEATAFKPSTSAPADTVMDVYTLDEDVGAVAWKDNGIIYYYNPSTTKISLGSDASELFMDCSQMTEIDMSGFDTSNVIDMSSMFDSCAALTSLDLSNFDTSNVEKMRYMFYECSHLTSIYSASDADWSFVENSDNMFEDCTALVGGKGTAYDSNHVDATYARVDSSSNPGYFTDANERTYSISVTAIVGEECGVMVNARSAPAGTEITLTPDAAPGYDFIAWDVKDASGEAVTVADNKFTMPASNVTVSATFTERGINITDALKAGVELTITFKTEGDIDNTVTFTRQTGGSYSETHDGVYTAAARASEIDGTITIDVTSGADYNDSYSMFTLDIYTNDSTYAEHMGEYLTPALQTIKVNGTPVILTPKTSD